MRCVVGLVACLMSALLVGACDLTTDSRYFKQGIGTDLYAPDMPEATQLQEAYLGVLCQQAGFQPVLNADGTSRCIVGDGAGDWGLIVQTGMNDIDRRCDGYLAWLDNRKRSIEPTLKQLSDTSTFTQAVLRATGVGANPITLVGLAFGLAADTFTNVNSRLLLEVNHSTVQSVVLSNQNKYRDGLRMQRVDNRPAAIYALRSYLRICEPFTIETQINTTVTLFERGGAAAIDRSPMITPKTVGTVIHSTQVLPPTPPPPSVLRGAMTSVEKTVSLASAQAFQRMLCVASTDGDFGSAGSPTRVALREFMSARLGTTGSDTIDSDAALRRLRDALAAFPSCSDAGFQNGFEVGIFSRFGSQRMRSDLQMALTVAGLAVPPGLTATTSPAIDTSVRNAISALRQKLNVPGPAAFDRAFYDAMANSITR